MYRIDYCEFVCVDFSILLNLFVNKICEKYIFVEFILDVILFNFRILLFFFEILIFIN